MVEDIFGRFVDVCREIGNVFAVGDLVVIDIEVKAVPMALCLHLSAVATLLRFMIFGQIIVSEFAVEILIHVAQFVAQDHASLGHGARCKRVVIVRSNVPINRNSHIQTTRRAHAERRRQETALALLSHGEHRPRGAQNGHAGHMKTEVFSRCHLGVIVDMQGVGFDPPSLATGLTSGNRRVFELGTDVAFKACVLRLTLKTTSSIVIVHVMHFARLGFDFVREFRAAEFSALTNHDGIAFHINFVGRLGVRDFVTANDRAGTTHFGVTTQQDLIVRGFHVVGTDETGGIFIDNIGGAIK